VNRERADVQKTISDLIKAIEDKERFIKVAQTRLQERSQRLGCENSHDAPMIGSVGDMILYARVCVQGGPKSKPPPGGALTSFTVSFDAYRYNLRPSHSY